MGCCSASGAAGEKKTVGIVGAGYAGVNLAKFLDPCKDFKVYLIDRKDYFLHNIGALRAAVVPGFVNSVIMPYHSLLKNGTFVKAEITSIKGTTIRVSGRDNPVSFDYLIIATGVTFGFPSKVQSVKAEEARNEYAKTVEQLSNGGKNIVIVGAGPVACELAGEIKAQYKDKEVTIVSKFDRLLSKDKPEKFVKRVEQCIEQRGIKIKRNITVDLSSYDGQSVIKGPVTLPLSNGESIQADIIYVCTGVTMVNNASYANEFTMDNNGRLKVNDFFQVEGQSNVFAIGDCIRMDEDRLAYYAQIQAGLLAKNLQALLKGKTMKPYKPGGYSTMFIPVGPDSGASLMMGATIGPFLTKMMKSSHLFAPAYAGILGVSLPVMPDKFQNASAKRKEDDEILHKLIG